MRITRFNLALLLLFAVTIGVLIVAASTGPTWIDPLHPSDAVSANIYWQLRLPRVLTAFAVGGLLAVAGAWFQVVLQNPLADPYVLGVAGSAAVGAVAASALFPGIGWTMSAGAFAGSMLGIGMVGFFSFLGPARLLLAGVVLATFWSAVLALMLSLLPAQELGRAYGWMLGDLTDTPLPVALLLSVLGISVVAGLILSEAMNRLLLGEQQARALGVPVRKLHLGLLLGASIMTAVAVTAAGTIGFVGLVVPHLVRLLVGPMHRLLLPAAALAGGILLVVADTVARTVVAPAELPVGVLTAMIGVPIFLFLLVHRR